MVTSGDHPPGLFRREDFGKAPARHGRHPGRPAFEARDVKEGGRKVNEAHIVIHHAARLEDAILPHDGERQVVRVVVGMALVVGERHAVVGRDDDQRVVEQAALLQFREHPPEVPVEMLHLECIVEHIVADRLVVRPAGGHAVNVGQFLPALGDPRTEFIAPVRLMPAVPETPRFIPGRRIEEVREVRRVVVTGDVRRRWRGLPFIERPSGHLPVLAGGVLRDARPPALAGHAGEVALFPERLREGLELGREIAPVVGRGLELPRVAPRQEARPRGGALAVGGVRMGEEDPLARHAVQRRGLDPGTAVGAAVAVRPVVGHGEEDVGFGGLGHTRGVERCEWLQQEGGEGERCEFVHGSCPS